MKLIYKKLFQFQPDDRTGVLCMATPCDTSGKLMKYCTFVGRSDTFSGSVISYSTDGGNSFRGEKPDRTRWKTPEGFMTRYFKSTLLNHETNRFYMFYNVGLLPSDNPAEGLKSWKIHYCMTDGFHEKIFEKPVVMKGHDADNPVEGVYEGKNSFMIGDWPCKPVITADKRILLPFQTSMFDKNGEIYNPGGGYTYQYSRVLHGRFMENGEIEWFDVSLDIMGDPSKSTRGMLEPAIAEMPDGRILMVMRGSNGGKLDPDFEIPGRRWFSVSEDGGMTFTEPRAWSYSDGTGFHSPSSCSGIIRHKNGKYYWIGNICEGNPRANMPRNPLWIYEIDEKSLFLKKDTGFVIEDKKKGQYGDVTFSNFHAYEEKSSGDILIHCTALWQSVENVYLNGDSYEYRLRPECGADSAFA